MKLTILFVTTILIFFSGCASMFTVPPFFRVRGPETIGRIDPVHFEKTIDKSVSQHKDPALVSIRFEVGSEITRERKAVNENGVIETTGYDKFSDGIILSLNLSRISDERYSIDLDPEVSAFDKTDKVSPVPSKSHSVLKSPGLLIRDGDVVYAGSLKRQDASKVFGIFSVDVARSSDILTIWVRAREIK